MVAQPGEPGQEMESRLTSPARSLAVLLALGASGLSAAQAQTRFLQMDEPRFIEVTGQASVDAVPDFARLTLGVATTGKDAREALAANSKAVNALIDLMKSGGVAAADIQTSNFSLSPTMTNPPAGSEGQRKIVGYSVSNMVSVTARDIAKLGPLIDQAVGAGANAMYGIAYGENDPGALLDAARPHAVEDARRKAEIFAKAGGAKIGRLLSLTEDGGATPAPMGRVYARMADAPTPIEPGRDTLIISVTARFELTQ
jgi:uncharacterized protein